MIAIIIIVTIITIVTIIDISTYYNHNIINMVKQW